MGAARLVAGGRRHLLRLSAMRQSRRLQDSTRTRLVQEAGCRTKRPLAYDAESMLIVQANLATRMESWSKA